MSLVAILKNVYSFIKLLKTCSEDAVSQWNRNSIDNVLMWARYCEQLYTQSKGKSYQAELDVKIQQIGQLSASCGNSFINLELLKDAQKLVYQRLIQNCHLSDSSFQYLVDKAVFSSNSGDKDNFHQMCFELCEVKSNVELAYIVQREASRLIEYPGSRAQVSDAVAQSEALILLQHISHSLKHSKNETRSENYLFQTFEKITMEIEKMNILLHCLMQDDVSDIENAKQCQNLVMKWILSKLQDTSSDGRTKKIWSTNPEILCHIAGQHFNFYIQYMKYLISLETEMFLAETNSSTNRCVEDLSTHELLLTHLRSLLTSGEKHVKSAVKATLSKLLAQDRLCLWRGVMKELQKDGLLT